MSNLSSTLKVSINGSGAKSGAAQVQQAVSNMTNSINRNIGQSSKSLYNFQNALIKVQKSSFGFFKSLINSAALAGFVHQMIKANKEFSAFIAISKVSRGSLQGAYESFENIKKISNTLGTSLEANLKSFGKFEAAMRPIDKSGALTQHIFEAMSIAASGLHLNSLQLELAFKAIEQAASKNKPSLEEFQRQLAEHIPGAMAYLAEGVGLRMDQIHDAISDGTVSIKDLLTGFSNVLKQRFGEAAQYASEQLPAAINRLKNAYFEFLVGISRSGAAEGIQIVVKALEDLIRNSEVIPAMGAMFKDLGVSVAQLIRSIDKSTIDSFVSALKTMIDVLIFGISNLKIILTIIIGGGFLGYIVKVVAALKTIAPTAVSGAGALKLLNGAMLLLRSTLMGPLGLIALVGSLLYALSKLDGQEKTVTIKMRDTNGRVLDSRSVLGNNNFVNKPKEIINSSGSFSSKGPVKFGKVNPTELGNIVQRSTIDQLLSTQELPGDTPVNNPKDKSSNSRSDPLDNIINDTSIKRLQEYYTLLGRINKLLANSKTKADKDLYNQALESLKRSKLQDITGEGNLFTVDDSVSDALKSQADSIKELEEDLASASKESIEFVNAQNSVYHSLKNTSAGDTYTSAMNDITEDTKKAVEELYKFQGVMSSDAFDFQLQVIVDIEKFKRDLATVESISEAMSQSQSIISSAEQSTQSRVISGLMSETAARMQLRAVIGEQGIALQRDLLPKIEAVMAATTDPVRFAQMKAMVDKINEMVAVGNQNIAYAGFIAGLEEYRDVTVDVFTEVKDVTIRAFNGMEDALVDFIMTGKVGFGDMVKSMIADMVRLQVRATMNSAMNLFGSFNFGSILGSLFANGGIMTSAGSVPLKTYSTGGIANSPQMAIYGEGRTPEAYVPLPDGRSIPVTMKGSSGGDVNTSITVNVSSNGQVSTSRDNASMLGKQIESAVMSVIVREKRPGGMLSEGA